MADARSADTPSADTPSPEKKVESGTVTDDGDRATCARIGVPEP